MKTLTVEQLKKCAFSQQCHVNGGSNYSSTTEINEEYGLSIYTRTNGSPDYKIKVRELSVIGKLRLKQGLHISLLGESPDFAWFVAKYNAYQQSQQ